jgi:hypothetical protein
MPTGARPCWRAFADAHVASCIQATLDELKKTHGAVSLARDPSLLSLFCLLTLSAPALNLARSTSTSPPRCTTLAFPGRRLRAPQRRPSSR